MSELKEHTELTLLFGCWGQEWGIGQLCLLDFTLTSAFWSLKTYFCKGQICSLFYLDSDLSRHVEEFTSDQESWDERHCKHIPHHNFFFLWSTDPAWNITILRASHIVVLTISTVVSLWDHPCSQTVLRNKWLV